ncbi:hypothetical protein PROQFM164_S12g000047 [Penicillium roqueforti FM164]|uniref:Uncharacterized protein n=1 Tax=Penicillium roqueforti (strain FM164) TaxID=1365484 RepID=W6QNE9_PENRF|nr:hypothetical protein PROQFM164_S12g000047 [Penicillium roqueforti FM164]
MAKTKPSQRKTGHRSDEGQYRATAPLCNSHRSAISGSKDDRNPLKHAIGLRKHPVSPITKRPRPKHDKETHRKCLRMVSSIEEEIQKAQEERDGERHKHCQLLEQLEAEKAEETSKLQLAITVRNEALADSQRVGQEICKLQQQLESTNTALQDLIPWNDIQLVLDQAHGDMVAMTTRFWNTIDALQNRRLASYLPGSGVIHADWPEQRGLTTESHEVHLGLSESNGPLPSHQEPFAANQDQSLF